MAANSHRGKVFSIANLLLYFRIAKEHTIPVGTYRADLRVWNLGRSFVLPGIYTIVVEPAAETADSGSREEG